MKELKLKIPVGGVLVEPDIDKVMDFIGMLPSEASSNIYKNFDAESGVDINLSFCINDMYCFIHKFSKEGDSGLVYVLSLTKEDMCDYVILTFPVFMAEQIIESILDKDGGNTKTGEDSARKNGIRKASKKEENKN